MQRLFLARAGEGLIVLFVVSVLVFFSSRLTGNPAQVLMAPNATPAEIEYLTHALGLDQPLPVQYSLFITSAAKGDFGKSLRTGRPVSELIFERLPNSISLAAVGMLFAVGIGLPLGVIAAARRGTWIDQLVRTVSVFGMAVPGFWLALVLMFIFAVELHWLPSARMEGPLSYVMPAFTISLAILAGMMRLLYSSMSRTLEDEYILLARLKGLPERWVIWKHAFRNALIPVVTFGGYHFALMIGASVAIEMVFAWPGIGRLGYEAVMWRDFPLLQGVILTVSALTVIMNLAVDIAYAYIDPRIRY